MPKSLFLFTQWRVGDHCQAVFTEDGQLYDAVIKSINYKSSTCWVTYIGYGNEEEHQIADLMEAINLDNTAGVNEVGKCDDWGECPTLLMKIFGQNINFIVSSGASHSDLSCISCRIHSDVSLNVPKKVYHILMENFGNLLHICDAIWENPPHGEKSCKSLLFHTFYIFFFLYHTYIQSYGLLKLIRNKESPLRHVAGFPRLHHIS